MGVRGLQTLASKYGGSEESLVIAPGSTVLLDGSGLLNVVLRGERFEHGGDYESLDKKVAQVFQRLAARELLVVVYTDGPNRRMKRHASLARLEQRREEWVELERACRMTTGSSGGRGMSFPMPRLSKQVFDASLKRLEAEGMISIVECEDEADQRLAMESATAGALILGEDSDFLLFRDCRYIRLAQLAQLTSGRAVDVWTRASVSAAFGIEEHLLVELAALLGNDYTAHLPVKSFRNAPTEGMRRNPESTLKWLKEQDAEEDFVLTAADDEGASTESAIAFTRALYELEDLEERWDLDEKLDHTALDGSPSKEAEAGDDEGKEDRISLVLLLLQQKLGPDVEEELDVLGQVMRSMLTRHLDAFAVMLEEGSSKAKIGLPEWEDVVAAYRYQHFFARSNLENIHRVFHGPSFHASLQAQKKQDDDMEEGEIAEAPTVEVGVLPIEAHREEILSQVAKNRVTIVVGETGCGKSSRIPLMLMESVKNARMYVTQPRRIAARGLCDRLRDGEGLGDLCGLRLGHGEKEGTSKTRLWFCTAGYLVRVLASQPERLANHTHLIVDEVHERSVETEILCLLARRLLDAHPTIRLVLMSATLCADLYEGYFGLEPGSHIFVGGRRFQNKTLYAEDLAHALRLPRKVGAQAASLAEKQGWRLNSANTLQYNLVVSIVQAVGCESSSILVFVAGMRDILELTDKIANLNKQEEEGRYVTVPIHSDLPFEEQLAVFSSPKSGQVRVILATNAAESSVTIPDCDHVICLGTSKQVSYNKATHRSFLDACLISKSSAIQRAGRTGRVRPGAVYRLYSRGVFEDEMDEHANSEIHRSPLDAVVLELLNMTSKLDMTAGEMLAETLEPPDEPSVDRAYASLHGAGLVTTPTDEDAELTSMGDFVAKLGVDLSLGRLVGLGAQLGMLQDAVAIAAILSQPKTPWRIANPLIHEDPRDYNDIAAKSFLSKCHWDKGMQSEPLAQLRLVRAYQPIKGSKRPFCEKHNVIESRMRQLVDAQRHLQTRALDAMSKQTARMHAFDCDGDITEDPARLNRLRLLLVWTSRDTIFQLKSVDHALNVDSVTFNGPRLEGHMPQFCFPPNIDFHFQTGTRTNSTCKLTQTIVDSITTLIEAGEYELEEGLDLVYYLDQDGECLLVMGPRGLQAAGDLVDRFVAKGAEFDQTDEMTSVRSSSRVSLGEIKDLKLLMDRCNAVSVSMINCKELVLQASSPDLLTDQPLLKRLLGCVNQLPKFKTQTIWSKQTCTFPPEEAEEGVFRKEMALGARLVAALVGGYRDNKLKLWVDVEDKEKGKMDIKVEVATPKYVVSALVDRPSARVLMGDHTTAKHAIDAHCEKKGTVLHGVAATMMDVGASGTMVVASGCTLLPRADQWIYKALSCFSVAEAEAALEKAKEIDLLERCRAVADLAWEMEDTLEPNFALREDLDELFGFSEEAPPKVVLKKILKKKNPPKNNVVYVPSTTNVDDLAAGFDDLALSKKQKKKTKKQSEDPMVSAAAAALRKQEAAALKKASKKEKQKKEKERKGRLKKVAEEEEALVRSFGAEDDIGFFEDSLAPQAVSAASLKKQKQKKRKDEEKKRLKLAEDAPLGGLELGGFEELKLVEEFDSLALEAPPVLAPASLTKKQEKRAKKKKEKEKAFLAMVEEDGSFPASMRRGLEELAGREGFDTVKVNNNPQLVAVEAPVDGAADFGAPGDGDGQDGALRSRGRRGRRRRPKEAAGDDGDQAPITGGAPNGSDMSTNGNDSKKAKQKKNKNTNVLLNGDQQLAQQQAEQQHRQLQQAADLMQQQQRNNREQQPAARKSSMLPPPPPSSFIKPSRPPPAPSESGD